MCDQCNRSAQRCSTVVDALVTAETAQRHLFPGDAHSQHVIRLTYTILEMHGDSDTGAVSTQGLHNIAMEYATVVQRLIALQEMSGMSPPAA